MGSRVFRFALALVAAGAALVALRPHAAAQESFDSAAAACIDDWSDLIDQIEDDYGFLQGRFYAATARGACLRDATVVAQGLAEKDLDTAPPEDRPLLKRRVKSLQALHHTTETAGDQAFPLSDRVEGDPASYKPGVYEKQVRKLLVRTTDLRFLGLVSFRGIWQEVIAAAQFRRAALLDAMDEDLDRLSMTAGAAETKAGKKASKLRKLADVLDDGLREALDGLAVPVEQVPAFGAVEDKAGRKRRKALKRTAHDYGSLLSVLARVAAKIDKKVTAAIEDATSPEGCPLTNPEVDEIGGGRVRVSVDDGPEVLLDGQTDLEIHTDLRSFWFGSHNAYVAGTPYILFAMEGAEHANPGVHVVGPWPERSQDGYLRDFVSGRFVERPEGGGEIRYNFVSGTLTIDALELGKKTARRKLTGSFDIVGETLGGGASKRFVGTFHLCRFGIEGENGIR